MKRKIRDVNDDPHVSLWHDTRTGIAWVEDHHTGCGHSCHPNISASGSIRGMKARGYWDRQDKCVRSHGFIYNISRIAVADDLDLLASRFCDCGGMHKVILERS